MPESAKDGARGLAEGSDIGLGPGCREFESRHSDHKGTVAMIQIATVPFNFSY